MRAAIRRAVPEAVEGIGYRMPGYNLHGKPMLYFRRHLQDQMHVSGPVADYFAKKVFEGP